MSWNKAKATARTIFAVVLHSMRGGRSALFVQTLSVVRNIPKGELLRQLFRSARAAQRVTGKRRPGNYRIASLLQGSKVSGSA